MTGRAMVFGALVWLLGLAAPVVHAEGGRVYRCTLDGRLTFSDRPCPGAVDSAEVDITPSNVYRAPDAVKTSAPSAARQREQSKPRESESTAAEQARAKQQCARIAEQLETLQNKLRSGYTAKQDQKLHERQRQLQEKQRIERC